jgi:MinD superfamily P-loop ATPase
VVLVDGPPGTGCPTISSLTGADLALVVTEPTPSGESDLARVLELAGHFRVPAAVVLNKADLSPERARSLEAWAEQAGAPVLARFPWDASVADRLRRLQVLSEAPGPWQKRFDSLWTEVSRLLGPTLTNQGGSSSWQTH